MSVAVPDAAVYPLPFQADARTVQQLVVLGVVREDDTPRFFSHFFDPWNNRKLTPQLWPSEEASPDRALDAPDRSLREARSLLVNGLREASPEIRRLLIGNLFLDLGHVIHHIQDMGQPEHTRNDFHPPGDNAYEKEIERCEELHKNIPDYLPGGGVVSLPTARSYWASSDPGQIDGLGLAEFSNRSFVTDATNFTGGFIDGITNQIGFLCTDPEFDFPNGNAATIESVPLANLRNESPPTDVESRVRDGDVR
jgi:hypothetical protein